MSDQHTTTTTGKHHAEDAPASEKRSEKREKKEKTASEVPQQGPETVEEIIDEWGEETFPASDPPANY